MIQKHKWPVLEYDDSREVMVKPNRNEGYRFPPRAVLFFHRQGVEEFVNGCRADALYAANHIGHPCEELGQFETITRPFTVYRVPVNGVDICLAAAPLGAGAAAQFMDFLIACGCTRILAGGSCGALEDLPENAFLLPTHALRGEGASYCYLPPARWVQTDQAALRALEQAAAHFGVPARRCRTWTTDGFFRETPGLVAYRRQEGCVVVEMECAALAACAGFHGVQFAQLLYTADRLAAASHSDRGWGEASVHSALALVLHAASLL